MCCGVEKNDAGRQGVVHWGEYGIHEKCVIVLRGWFGWE